MQDKYVLYLVDGERCLAVERSGLNMCGLAWLGRGGGFHDFLG